jgi:hypothetical protein
MNIELKCENCNQSFITKFKHRDKKFCNRKCYFEYANKNNLLGKVKDDSVREERICLQCGDMFNERIKYKRKLCSNKCRLLWNDKVENKTKRLDKSKKVLFEKYGTESLFKNPEFQEKIKKNFVIKYGFSHPMHIEKFVNKLKNTIKENHLPHLIKKLNENNIELIDEYINNKDKNTSRSYKFKCSKCETIFTSTLLGSGKIPICRKCNPLFKNSKIEQLVKDFLNENDIDYINNDRKILNGKEIDILLTEYKIGFEINGNYYHSEIHGEKDKKYHIDKTIITNDKNIKLIHIFEDEINLKPNIVKSRVKNILGLTDNKIFARKCTLRELNKKESILFLDKNHIQGNSVDKIRIGLFYQNNLVSIMTFGKKRKVLGNNTNSNEEIELIRFCNILNTNVIGGFSKLLNFFIKKYSPKSITTYADIRWSGINPKDTVYLKNGFKYINNTPPNYWYVKTDDFLHRSHRFNFRKDVLLKEGFDTKLTEWEIMKKKGYDRIWDCGSMKFEIIFSCETN